MANINDIPVVDRHNRPSVLSKVMLRAFFSSDGHPQHPYAIKSVQIFRAIDLIAPNTIFGDDGLVSPEGALKQLMCFAVASETGQTGLDDEAFAETNYTGIPETDEENNYIPGDTAVVGIYNLDENPGEFAVVLDGTYGGNLSGVDTVHSLIVQNMVSSTQKYVDVWTIKSSEESEWKTVIHAFELYDDTFLSLTQPLLVHTKNKLWNKRIRLGSKVDIKVGTEITIQNKDIDEATKNIIKGQAINDADLYIYKHNEDVNLPARVLVASGTTTSGGELTYPVEITSDNTIIFNFDTNAILVNPDEDTTLFNNSHLGSRTGTYSVQVEYDIVKEHIVSPLFYLIIN